VSALESPIAGHEYLQQEMSKVVFLIDEETSVEVEIDRLQYGDQQQGHEMQGI
jgi:hypothetical protein